MIPDDPNATTIEYAHIPGYKPPNKSDTTSYNSVVSSDDSDGFDESTVNLDSEDALELVHETTSDELHRVNTRRTDMYNELVACLKAVNEFLDKHYKYRNYAVERVIEDEQRWFDYTFQRIKFGGFDEEPLVSVTAKYTEIVNKLKQNIAYSSTNGDPRPTTRLVKYKSPIGKRRGKLVYDGFESDEPLEDDDRSLTWVPDYQPTHLHTRRIVEDDRNYQSTEGPIVKRDDKQVYDGFESDDSLEDDARSLTWVPDYQPTHLHRRRMSDEPLEDDRNYQSTEGPIVKRDDKQVYDGFESDDSLEDDARSLTWVPDYQPTHLHRRRMSDEPLEDDPNFQPTEGPIVKRDGKKVYDGFESDESLEDDDRSLTWVPDLD